MDYQRVYNNIIQKYKDLNLSKKDNLYVETHHIIPRCIGGTNEKDNLVNLTAKAHFICHLLLPKIYKNDFNKYTRLFQALFMMSVMKNSKQDRHIITSRQYEIIRLKYSEFRKNTPQSQEANEKRRQKLLGRKVWNAGLTKETSPILKLIGEKVSKANKGRKFSKETLEKLKKAARKNAWKMSGKNNMWYDTKGPMGGKHHTEERNKKMSEWMKLNNPFRGKHHTEESNKKNSEKVKAKWKDPEYREKLHKFHTTKVICIETGIIYSNACIASRMTKIKGISKCCRGELETAGGFHWKNYEISPL